MLQIEVVVAPFLVARINLIAERLAEIERGLMPVHRIFLEAVVGGQIEAAAEPPHRIGTRLFGDKKRTLAWLVGT